ncbi:hypothetical protein A2303_01885 [Candidatus Falkowbacteria bacterium RIFOXYB2_FULL_47_14]|uniref:Uncharacterized protein n=1 Tax=Candidatus Falkowbacteria bacterium RIFOXYA2_FULL_47_19 TaxID=1797994 RepID=A0A1F5SN88_9BACT|nr:MAG: hypothetical protein A2227_06805 [Candidatus Falkowbacteria bacterium RIFOXYA2_FULL_47_19]OGF34586.1 MAG: hypothetical protein A2468_07785 [Candidatus Falkowbacteria bacterium RIFOXYC2_FULL_46_15]OGF43204.1 MAG: hypothetical protein A2303_01885 [Candidatus Falkowbacteria bacterium RIFOXYB2_FULL_47_14]
MKLIIYKQDLPEPLERFMRHAGYAPHLDSFVRRLTRLEYPRFHVYLKEEKDRVIINLHLDQKKPSYGGGTHAHSGEYDGELVRGEIGRLKELLIELLDAQSVLDI